jgi:hypothetical protein
VNEFVDQFFSAGLFQLQPRLQRLKALLYGADFLYAGFGDITRMLQVQVDRLLRRQHQIPTHLPADEQADDKRQNEDDPEG